MIYVILILFVFGFAFPFFSVYAYLDPGTGSYLTQLAIAFLFGTAYLTKVYWNKIKSVVRSFFDKFKKNANSIKN